MQTLIKRTYRIHKHQDKSIKKYSKKYGGENEFIRVALDEKINSLQALSPTKTTRICACGNRGYTALVNNTHLEGCPNYSPTKTDKKEV